MLTKARFVDRALRSVEDGLIVAGVDGRITFVNPRAAQIMRPIERTLFGSDLFERLSAAERNAPNERDTRETLIRLLVDRVPVEREITIGEAPARHYTLRMSAVCSGDDGAGTALGIVASLSDITKQRELQQMKNDAMAFVTHEMKTPLTAMKPNV